MKSSRHFMAAAIASGVSRSLTSVTASLLRRRQACRRHAADATAPSREGHIRVQRCGGNATLGVNDEAPVGILREGHCRLAKCDPYGAYATCLPDRPRPRL